MRKPKKLPLEYPYPTRQIGYARVSTPDQDLRMQTAALERAGIRPEDIYTDKISGRKRKRPGLEAAIAACRPGDTLTVYKIDRLSRRARHLFAIADELTDAGIGLRSLQEAQYDTNTPMGKFMLGIFALLAELESDTTGARTMHGIEAKRARGETWGPERKLTDSQVQTAMRALKSGQTLSKLARRFKVTGTTLRTRILEANGGKKLWPDGPRARKR
jgi:DNA invertase Pin-like site-specific DNA recombinase